MRFGFSWVFAFIFTIEVHVGTLRARMSFEICASIVPFGPSTQIPCLTVWIASSSALFTCPMAKSTAL